MTIRYTCTECGSVLKIKDEKAGTQGKCPKCKTEFLVPNPDEPEDDGIELESSPEEEPADLVDMPIELTPEVEAAPEDFNPLSVLGGSATGGSLAKKSPMPSSGGPASDRKPSVAELMKDFEATKKKDREKKPVQETSRPSSSSSAAETSGSAADALSRAYQQKRDSSSAPSVSAKDAKASEERALLVDFIKTKAAPAVVVIGVLIYGYIWWMNREVYNGPPLYPVSGQIIRASGAGGIRISFDPIVSGPTDLRAGAYAMSDKDGNFTLSYSASLSGAPAGEYRVGLMGNDGIPIPPPGGELKLTVKEDGPNEFTIKL